MRRMRGGRTDWYLSASSARRDSENSNIVYKDVTVRVKGVLSLYSYLRMQIQALIVHEVF